MVNTLDHRVKFHVLDKGKNLYQDQGQALVHVMIEETPI